jgi:uncharacterized protein with ParB-like and HNH nuclease domain
MREIIARAKTIREILGGAKYSIDYYQREYKWGEKQVKELIDDLSAQFLQAYQPGHSREKVESYGHYFLGSIIISRKDGINYLVDGQQRLTTISLLLIYLNNLRKQNPNLSVTSIDELIYSEKFGKKSFNLNVAERAACMEALFEQQPFESSDQPESVRNIAIRYEEITQNMPPEVAGDALPYFVDWLIENVHFVEITAYSDEDAYIIFETMNDRGLSLSPTDMLKSYLLANIENANQRDIANAFWKARVLQMNGVGKDVAADSFKVWLRSQYANTIRERKKGAKPQDFDLIGTEFHRWVRDNHKDLNLNDCSSFERFIERDFRFFSHQYLRLLEASSSLEQGLEHVLYNAHHDFTLQYILLLAPLKPEDRPDVVDLKLSLVAKFIDILITWRLWNFRSIAYSTMQYAMFLVMRDIRGLDPKPLAVKLRETLDREQENFVTNDRLYLHQQNRWYLHRILSRMTDYIEQQSGMPSHYTDYVSYTYEVEHIWADKPERHIDEFPHPVDFLDYRNRLGGLLILPKSFNASYGALTYAEKLPHYNTQNLLARSLHPLCYEHNPGFLRFVASSGLPFRAHREFKKEDLDARQELLRQLAERIWNPDDLFQEVAE